MEGLDEAVIGTNKNKTKLVYSITKGVKILMERDNMDYLEAIDFIDYNYENDKNTIWRKDFLK